MDFFKLNGAGNDFIAFDNRDGHLPAASERPAWLNRVCKRGKGVGADGALILEDSDRADVRLRFHNADGPEAEMCGNGLRCLVRFAHHVGALGATGTVETMAGLHTAEVLEGDSVRVSITDPVDIQQRVPMRHGDQTFEALLVNPGVPHVAIEMESRDDLEALDIDTVGRALRHHSAVMPAGANVNFFIREGGPRLRMRTFERGVEAETMACGTGAVSCAVKTLLSHGGDDGEFEVITRSDLTLGVHLKRNGDSFTDTLLEGPAVLVYSGSLAPDFQP